MVDYATKYGEAGFPVFPVRECGKQPLTTNGFKDASADIGTIRSMWRAQPRANIGWGCDGAGLVALDEDPRHGGDTTIASVVAEHGPLVTRVQATGGGGRHYLYRLPANAADLMWRGQLGPGVDIKVRGYILVAPSVHPSGQPYRWMNRERIAPAPAWLLDMATRPALVPEHRPASPTDHAHGDDFWEAVWNLDCEEGLRRLSGHRAVGGEVFTFRRAGNGNRNVLVDRKGTSCWIDRNGRIGSFSKGGPTLYAWLRWYGNSPRRCVDVLREVFPQLPGARRLCHRRAA